MMIVLRSTKSVSRRPFRVFAAVAVLLCVATVASAAVQIRRLAQVTARAEGPFDVYGYNTGLVTTSDVGADWAAGTLVETVQTPDGNSVELRRRGDVAPDPANAWWDLLWRTRRCYTVTNSTAAVATNGRVTLTLDTGPDIAAGWMQAGGVDLRATTGGATPTPLSFNAAGPFPSATSTVTVEIPTLAAGASTPVCLYWGNAAATSASVTLTAPTGTPLYRIAAGINVGDTGLNWTDSESPILPAGVAYLQAGGGIPMQMVSPSTVTFEPGPPVVPAATPLAIFTNARRHNQTGVNDFVEYQFSSAVGTLLEVRFFVAEPNQSTRNFGVRIDGLPFLSGLNPPSLCTAAGLAASCGIMRSAPVTSDGVVNVRIVPGTSGSGNDRRSIFSAIEIRQMTSIVTLTPSGGARREGLVPALGTWTSPVIDSGSGSTIYGTILPSFTSPNLAVNKPLTSSTVDPTSTVLAGNDARRDGTPFLTTNQNQPFWEVDLGSVQPISRVNAFTTSWAMVNVAVFVSPTSLAGYADPGAAISAGVPNIFFAGSVASDNMDSVFPSGTTGRYVRIWSSSAASLLNLKEVEVIPATASGVTTQVAFADAPGGPWNFVGPDGTAATSYSSLGAFPYIFDNHRYYRVQSTLQSLTGIASPLLDSVRTRAGLTVLPRSADGWHLYTAPDTGVNWITRIKTSLPNIAAAATATLHAENPSTWTGSLVSGHLDRTAVSCCLGNAPFFSTAGVTTDQTPVTLFDVGGNRNLSVVLDRVNDVPAIHGQIVEIALSATLRVQVPLRRISSTASVPTNIALGKAASQSTTDFGGIASRGNDGNTSGQYFTGSSVTHTAAETNPWWQVDLASVRMVDQVEVYNRLDCCSNRLTNFHVILSPTPISATLSVALADPAAVIQTYSAGTFTTPITLTFPSGSTGRYVRLWKTAPNTAGSNYLHVAEVRVIGPN
jgi:F5/8 type C domain